MKRRQFLKATGAASAVAGGVGLGFFGYEAGRDPLSYSGMALQEGAFQNFNRKKWAKETPHYEKVGPTRRVDARTEMIFARRGDFMRYSRRGTDMESLPDYLKQYYQENPEALEEDKYLVTDVQPKFMQDMRKYNKEYFLSEAWSNAMGAVSPPPVNTPPAESDFPRSRRGGGAPERVKLKNPAKTSKLIKKISHQLGSVLVGIAELNPDWVYGYPLRGRGFEPDTPLDIPKHWKYAIVVGSPMSWDPLYANPNFGTSNDAYSRTRIVAFRVAAFIRQLGYAARPHTPGTSYDLVVPPIAIDAGLGEQGRHGVLITPELGSNIRPAVITTDIPLEPDKPIDIGIQDFCKTCKICAEQCPSGAIPFGGKEEVRGYRRYLVNKEKCHTFWSQNMGNMGCRICVACCPYTRKANWVHKAALSISLHDPTGLADAALTGLQKRFYPGPDPETYYSPSFGGENASYRKPPWWLRTEDFIE
ncbi:reductive dehalogenase [Acidobacteriota bacterium]